MIKLTIMGSSIEVPVYVAEPVVDLHCCVYGKLYRKLILKNRCKIAIATTRSRAASSSLVLHGLHPAGRRLRDGHPLPARLDHRAALRYTLPDRGVIAVPVRVLVPDQALPVYYTLRAQLTRGELTFSQSALDFGPCYVTQSLVHHVTLTNESMLPQKFGFVNLKPELDVQPFDGFGILLPHESKTVDAFFKFVSAIESDLKLTIRTTMN